MGVGTSDAMPFAPRGLSATIPKRMGASVAHRPYRCPARSELDEGPGTAVVPSGVVKGETVANVAVPTGFAANEWLECRLHTGRAFELGYLHASTLKDERRVESYPDSFICSRSGDDTARASALHSGCTNPKDEAPWPHPARLVSAHSCHLAAVRLSG